MNFYIKGKGGLKKYLKLVNIACLLVAHTSLLLVIFELQQNNKIYFLFLVNELSPIAHQYKHKSENGANFTRIFKSIHL